MYYDLWLYNSHKIHCAVHCINKNDQVWARSSIFEHDIDELAHHDNAVSVLTRAKFSKKKLKPSI